MIPKIAIAGFEVPSYSLMIAIGFLAYLTYLYFTFTRTVKVKPDTLNRLLVVSILGFAVLGISAYIFDGIFHSIAEKKVVFGGITWLGGVIGAFPATVFMLHKFVPEAKGRSLEFFSRMLPGIVLAHAFGRLGCFLAGCCYGQVTDSALGVLFPGKVEKRLPTQLFEAVFEFVLFGIMLGFRKKTGKHNIEMYCFAYGVFRFIMEFFRGDNRGSSGLGLSPSQVICILLWVSGTLLILYKNGKIFKKLAKKSEEWREEFRLDQIKKKEDRRCCAALSAVNAIRELHKLSEEGIITKKEFEETKKKLLQRIE